jgi:hypothetical protein
MYEVAAFEALNNGLRCGNLYVLGNRRYQTFDSYLLTKQLWTQLKESGQTRLALGGTRGHAKLVIEVFDLMVDCAFGDDQFPSALSGRGAWPRSSGATKRHCCCHSSRRRRAA